MRAWLILALLAWGCAKKAPPSGGPPDLEPPRLVSSQPDSGAAAVPRAMVLSLTFSEGMEPRLTGDAIEIAPLVDVRRLRWSGRTVQIQLADTLRADQTYQLLVGGSARDRRGNAIEAARSIAFTTADSFPPGRIEGRLEARGFTAIGTYLWCYDLSRRESPDSTARDFHALGLVDAQGGFRVPGLPVPARYRLWAFADLNRNRSFEPERDVLALVDTVFALSAERPVASDVLLRVVNPRAPAQARGTVVDSLPPSEGMIVVMAVGEIDSTRRVLAGVNDEFAFDLLLEPGPWIVRAFRDLDRNRVWSPAREPASDPWRIAAEPALEIQGVVLEIKPVPKE